MSPLSKTHIDDLLASVKIYASSPLFKLPEAFSSSGATTAWTTITYRDYLSDVEHVARYLTAQLLAHEVPKGSVVGFWAGGMQYNDFVYVAALGRAGYTPQTFSLSLTFPGIVFELLKKSGALALVHSPSFDSALTNAPLPTISAIDLKEIALGPAVSPIQLPDSMAADDDGPAFICHTSGSTSGSPKLVPLLNRWVHASISKIRAGWAQARPINDHMVVPLVGSICHVASLIVYLGTVHTGGCIVFPSKIKFSSEELNLMVRVAGINQLSGFSPLIALHLKEARTSPGLLTVLRSLSSVRWAGAQLPDDHMDWGFENQIPLANLYATTECGVLMLSTMGMHPRYLKVIPGIIHKFEAIDESSLSADERIERLYELVILPESPEYPGPTLAGPGGIHRTGDLFEPAKDYPDMWIFRGRGDDWIKDENTKRCDTRAIEDKVHETCSELINDCIVVGNLRPCPAIFVESAKPELDEEQRQHLQAEIIRRTSDFSARRYVHERVTDSRLVYVLDDGKLPRTASKGNIRRKAVEEQFKDELDAMYASLA